VRRQSGSDLAGGAARNISRVRPNNNEILQIIILSERDCGKIADLFIARDLRKLFHLPMK
jgi:hypothetical protein